MRRGCSRKAGSNCTSGTKDGDAASIGALEEGTLVADVGATLWRRVEARVLR